MPRVKYSGKQIIHKIREAEVFLGQGQTVKAICRNGISQTPRTIAGARNRWASDSTRRNGSRIRNA